MRPKHATPHEGIAKNKNAIINCLSRCNGKYIFGAKINVCKNYHGSLRSFSSLNSKRKYCLKIYQFILKLMCRK